MPRKRTTAAEAAATPADEPVELTADAAAPDVFDQAIAGQQAAEIVQQVADSTAMPANDDRPAPAEPGKPLPPLGRGWAQRYVQPVKYAHSTFKDAMGKEHIAFRFDLPPGQTKPDDAIIEVMRDHKFFKDGKPNGLAADAKSDPESYPTGLHFDNLPRGGKAWLIQNDTMGRTVADSIDQALDGLAKKMENGVGGPG